MRAKIWGTPANDTSPNPIHHKTDCLIELPARHYTGCFHHVERYGKANGSVPLLNHYRLMPVGFLLE
jgi:hypothetical protein